MAQEEKSKPFGKITVLRQLRERAGLSREQLVTRLDNRVSLRTLQRWENLGTEPTLTRRDWLDLCKALGVRWDDLPISLSDWVDINADLTAV